MKKLFLPLSVTGLIVYEIGGVLNMNMFLSVTYGIMLLATLYLLQNFILYIVKFVCIDINSYFSRLERMSGSEMKEYSFVEHCKNGHLMVSED